MKNPFKSSPRTASITSAASSALPASAISSTSSNAFDNAAEALLSTASAPARFGTKARTAKPDPALRRSHVFGKGINHIKPFLGSALQNFTLVAPVLLVAAVVMSILAVNQAGQFISAFTKEIKSAEVSGMSPLVDKKALIGADYQSAANIIAKNNSAVQVALSRTRNAIVISVKDPSLLPEFMYALTTIQSYRQGVAWNAEKLCLNKCEGGNAAVAEITGYTQSIQFTGLRPN